MSHDDHDYDDEYTLDYDRQRFGKAVRTYRGPQEPKQFARRAGISPAVLSRVERGKIVFDDVIERLCRLMGVDLADFPSGQAGKQAAEREQSPGKPAPDEDDA